MSKIRWGVAPAPHQRRCLWTPQGALPLDPAREKEKGRSPPLDPFSRSACALFPTAFAWGALATFPHNLRVGRFGSRCDSVAPSARQLAGRKLATWGFRSCGSGSYMRCAETASLFSAFLPYLTALLRRVVVGRTLGRCPKPHQGRCPLTLQGSSSLDPFSRLS